MYKLTIFNYSLYLIILIAELKNNSSDYQSSESKIQQSSKR